MEADQKLMSTMLQGCLFGIYRSPQSASGMEKKMETIGSIGVICGLYRDYRVYIGVIFRGGTR